MRRSYSPNLSYYNIPQNLVDNNGNTTFVGQQQSIVGGAGYGSGLVGGQSFYQQNYGPNFGYNGVVQGNGFGIDQSYRGKSFQTPRSFSPRASGFGTRSIISQGQHVQGQQVQGQHIQQINHVTPVQTVHPIYQEQPVIEQTRVQQVQQVQPVVIQPVHYIKTVNQVKEVEGDDSEWRERLAQKDRLIADLEEECARLRNKPAQIQYQTKTVEVEKRSRNDINTIDGLEKDCTRLNGKVKEQDAEIQRLRKKITTIETTTADNSQWEAKIRILTTEIERLTKEYEAKEQEMQLYKKKYVDCSSAIETLNEVMAMYVIQSALVSSLKAQIGAPKQADRKSIVDALADLDKSGGSMQTSRRVVETTDYI